MRSTSLLAEEVDNVFIIAYPTKLVKLFKKYSAVYVKKRYTAEMSFYINSSLMLKSSFFSRRDTCTCVMPSAEAVSTCVLF